MSYRRTIHLADTDTAGVVYFATLLSICHEAYEESLKESGISLRTIFQEQQIAIPIAHAEIAFFRPLFWGDEIMISVVPEQISEHEFVVSYEILTFFPSEHCVAKGKSRHISSNSRRRIPLCGLIQNWLENKNHLRSENCH